MFFFEKYVDFLSHSKEPLNSSGDRPVRSLNILLND